METGHRETGGTWHLMTDVSQQGIVRQRWTVGMDRRPDEIPAGAAKSLGNTGGTCPAFPQERARGAEGGRFSWRRSNGVKRFGRAGLQARGVGGSGVAGSPWGAPHQGPRIGPFGSQGLCGAVEVKLARSVRRPYV